MTAGLVCVGVASFLLFVCVALVWLRFTLGVGWCVEVVA